MPTRYELMECFDDQYPSIEDWYLSRIKGKLDLVSPEFDGTNPQKVILSVKDILSKADLTSADTGAVNALYSLGVFIQYLTKANTLGALPKRPWRVQGYRAVKTASKTSGLGIAEAAALGTAVEPVFYEVAPSPKEIELVSSYSTRLGVLSVIADAVAVDQNRQVVEKDFFRSLNADVLADYDTLAANNFEGLDRLDATSGETTAVGYTAGDEDFHGIDKSVETWAEPNSLYAASGTDRDLDQSLIDALRKNQEPYFESFPDGKVYITGFDTWDRWSRIIAPQQRFSIESVSFTVGDGIRTSPGQQTGFKIASYDGVPVIRDDLATKGADTLSHVFMQDFDMERLGIAFGRPIEYAEKGGELGDHFVVGHTIKGLWYGIGELYCEHFKSQGKLRDLK